MADPATLIALATTATAALAIATAAALKGWAGWLAFRRRELLVLDESSSRPPLRSGEIAELRERVRRLEAIASGTG